MRAVYRAWLYVFAMFFVVSVFTQYLELFLICHIIWTIPLIVASRAIIRGVLLLMLKRDAAVSNAADATSRTIPSAGLSKAFFILIFLLIFEML